MLGAFHRVQSRSQRLHFISHEAYLYISDALIMFLAMIIMNWIHPSEVAASNRGHGRTSDRVIGTKDVQVFLSAIDDTEMRS